VFNKQPRYPLDSDLHYPVESIVYLSDNLCQNAQKRKEHQTRKKKKKFAN